MPSLKEIRGRINSVNATLKITDVTRMISSAKLHKSQNELNSFRPYKDKITSIFYNLANLLTGTPVPLMKNNAGSKNVIIVAFSSNTGLAGAFNMNVIKKTNEVIDRYRSQSYNITLYTIGQKVYDGFSQYRNITLEKGYTGILEHPSYAETSKLAENLIQLFLNNKADEVVIIHNKFKNILTQYITEKKLLPLELPQDSTGDFSTDYIMEPDKTALLKTLAPQSVKLELFESLLESLTAEFGARSSAMQTATDNGNDLINELNIQYNKVRQSAITGELIDIVGGSEALK